MTCPAEIQVRIDAGAIVITLFMLVTLSSASPQYQFSSFSGPVSGSSKEAPVPRVAEHFDHNRPLGALKEHDPKMQFGAALDYVARPDYTFAYGVEDPLSGNIQSHQEYRDGDVVHGRYRVLDSDGSVRTVTYTADPEKGFQADVHRTPPDPAAAPPEHYEAPEQPAQSDDSEGGYQPEYNDGQNSYD